MLDITQTNRDSARQPILLDARCRKSSWIVNQVELVNISEGGCCIAGRMEGLSAGDEVSLRIADLAPMQCSVRWVEERRAGISFKESVSSETVEELTSTYQIGQSRKAGRRGGLRAA